MVQGNKLFRGYGQQEKKRALKNPSLRCSKTSEGSVLGNGGTEVPLVVIYNPLISHLGLVICKNFSFLYQDEEVKQVFTHTPFVSFCSVGTLRSHL